MQHHYYQHDGTTMYLNDLLNLSPIHRCAELNLQFDRCSLKELQHFFPHLVHSIFGNNNAGTVVVPPIGWGLRTMTGLTNAHEFDMLHQFFLPMGPMFRLCYRLLNESIKFEVPLDALPTQTADMLHGGGFAQFYADMINVDPTVRQITSLSLNAFDYYMLHFALHGMHPLHLMHPAAMDVHTEKRKTLYIYLVADYMCSFLPSHPDAIVLPTNICGSMKMNSVMAPIQPTIQPTRSPKYLKMSALIGCASPGGTANTPASPGVGISSGAAASTLSSGNAGNNSAQSSLAQGSPAPGSAGAPDMRHTWRTESVLHLFVDTWLLYDVDAHLELPSSEFIRAVRICVKQLHAFANAADLDHMPAMAALRRAVPPLMGRATYTLLCALIRRWPMDSSFSVVLELWLSYIQPWRYSFERIHGAAAGLMPTDADAYASAQIRRQFEPFVKENMRAYTQILVQLLPRFERLNFASLKNVLMMCRLLKVFSQANLPDLLRANEFDVFATASFMSTSSPSHQHRIGAGGGPPRTPPSASMSPTSPYHSTAEEQHDASGASASQAANYVCMFGAEVQQVMLLIGEKMLLARQTERVRAAQMEAENARRFSGGGPRQHGISIAWWWRRWLHWLAVSEEDAVYAQAMADCRKIDELLDVMVRQLEHIFEVNLPDLPEPATADEIASHLAAGTAMLLDETDRNNSFDMSMSFSEANLAIKPPNHIIYTVDPAVIPTKSFEIPFLVRFLYQLSSKLNFMFHRELEQTWFRSDLIGRIARQVLSGPLLVHSFDKSHGVSRVCERRLAPRINLRPLASYQALALIGVAFAGGQFCYGVPSFGFIALLLLWCVYVFVSGVCSSAVPLHS